MYSYIAIYSYEAVSSGEAMASAPLSEEAYESEPGLFFDEDDIEEKFVKDFDMVEDASYDISDFQ